jgi:hypothetical protein
MVSNGFSGIVILIMLELGHNLPLSQRRVDKAGLEPVNRIHQLT